MSSSRSTSPANDSMSGSPAQLSPRSKVRAMLAALDDDLDAEAPSSIRQPKLNLGATANTIPRVEQGDSQDTPNTQNEGSEDDEEVTVRPRGRLAARMNAVNNQASKEEDQGAANATTDAKVVPLLQTRRSPYVTNEDAIDGNNDGEDILVVSRKRKVRGSRASTPTPNPVEHFSPGGMFVSPAKSASPSRDNSESDGDLPSNLATNARFIALVEKRRGERLAKDEEIQRRKVEEVANRRKLEKNHSDMLEDDILEDSDDDDGGRRLTQQIRPMRKASKKALEEMQRETQRMNRNMQLAHQAKTKKKITKSSLFARFNYKPAGFVEEDEIVPARPATSSSAPQSDTEMKETPPTSPEYHNESPPKLTTIDQAAQVNENNNADGDSEEDMPHLSEALSKSIPSSPPALISMVDKGKGKAVEEPVSIFNSEPVNSKKVLVSTKRPIRIPSPKIFSKPVVNVDDSDSDLEIVSVKTPLRKKKQDSIFDRVPARQAQESHSLHALRMLAHLTSPGKEVRGRNFKPSMTATELTMSLQQRARQQAAREREERLQALRERGVIVQTAEERENEMVEIEDLMAKARREGEELMKKEKEASKKERKANGEVDPLGDSSDDGDWEEEKESFAELLSASGSGSDVDADGEDTGEELELEEEEEEDEDETAVDNDELHPTGVLFDNEASESDTEEDDIRSGDEDEDEAKFIDDNEDLPAVVARRRTKQMVVSDDDEEEATPAKQPALPRTDSPAARHSDSPVAPPSVLRSATKTFIPGLTVAGPAGLGLTQIFAGTMDDGQTQEFTGSPGASKCNSDLDTEQDSLAFLRHLPAPGLPPFEPTMDDDSQDIVRDSQNQLSQISGSPVIARDSQTIQLNFSQSQIHGFDSLVDDPFATQVSEFPDPTQDAGFQTMSPIKGRFAEPPPSTVDTVIFQETPLPERVTESPIAKKKGRLYRRAQVPVFSDDDDETSAAPINEEDDFNISADVFDVMRKASRKKEVIVDDFDKKKSGAKEMVQEQADESEDEYAGLGGASDDESGGEEDAYVKEMIDDEAGKDADESKLAAFYADKERASDEKQVEKLFRDITNGTLRRKRGADYSLSDSDDDGEARRRMKRKEFAKMRKALLEDERIGKIAENPKKLAFLRAIEDRGEDDEMDFLDDFDESQDGTDSHSQGDMSQQDVSPVDDRKSIATMGPPKRKLPHDVDPANRLPPNLRRTKPAKRPSNLSEIRDSLSSLIEEPNAILAESESDSELETEGDPEKAQRRDKEKENRDPFAPRRNSSVSVVDRISLKRASSNNVSTSTRLAFAAPSSTPGFKVPALLRRATTNSSISSISGSSLSGSSVSGMERGAGGFGDDGKTVAKKAGKNSGVQYMARENERKIKLVEGEKKREEKRWKDAVGRRKAVGGLLGRGKFE